MRASAKAALAMLTALAVASGAERAAASGFQLFDQSPSGEGNAFAGAAAVAEDASTIFANPAGLTYLDGIQAEAGINVIMPDGTFHPSTTRTAPSPLSGLAPAPLTGQGSRDFGEAVPAPHIYAAVPLDPILKGLWAGLGISTPFGLVTDYGSTSWVGRYYAERTQLKTIDVNPSLAYRPVQWLSLGAGVDVLHGNGLFKNAIDFGSICRNAAGPACGLFGLAPQAADGQVSLQGSDTTVGWNLGAIVQPLDETRIGLAYRSGYTLRLNGSANFTVPAAYRALQTTIPAFGGNFVNTAASAKINLPATASLSLAEQLTPKWTLLGDVSWTEWSRFKNFTVTFANPAQPQQNTVENWHDTFRESLGAIYAASDRAKLRFGVAYDPTPVPSANRTLNIPDDSRVWLSIGYGIELWKGLTFDAAYSHLFVPGNASVALSSPTQGTVSGTFSSSVDIVTLGVKYTF